MKTHNRFVHILVALLILVSQFAYPTLAYADDKPPATPTEAVTETPPPTEGTPMPTETLPVSDSPTVDPVPTTEVPAETSPAEEPALTEMLADLPAETDVVVLDENGQPLPLVTQEAAEIIAESDPMWCPATVTTVTGDCVNAATVAELLTLLASKNQDGIIYFTSTYTTNDVTFDGTNSNIDQLADNNLTLQGGWNGNITPDSPITYSGNSILSVPISINYWTGDVIINNITGSTTYKGLFIQGDPDHLGTGKGGNVTITNSNFTGNSSDGASIWDMGNITITNSDLSGNNEMGLLSVNVGDVKITNSHLDSNGVDGMYIGDADSVTITDSSTIGNIWHGTYLLRDGNITITNSHFDGTSYVFGAYIGDAGDVTISNSSFNNNGNWGYPGTYIVAKNITISDSTFNENGDYGLYVNADNNVRITDSSFSQNWSIGISLNSQGDVTMENVTAEGNGDTGIFVATPGDYNINISAIGSNGGYGIDASNVCGWFNSDENVFINNGLGNYNRRSSTGYTYTYTYLVYDPGISPPTLTLVEETRNCEGGGVIIDNVVLLGDQPLLADQYEFELSCATQSSYLRTLSNGDRVQIICPVTGKAILQRLENTMLPASLPSGYTYASAFSLEILQNDQPILYIGEGGKVNASFKVPAVEPGTIFSVLYWDAEHQTWTRLKDFILDENGKTRVFPLYPDDPRLIESGLNFVTEQGSLRAEVSTNFPGVFVLVQH